MKLAYLFWKPVQKMPQMLNKLSWPWLPLSRIGTHMLFLLTTHSLTWPLIVEWQANQRQTMQSLQQYRSEVSLLHSRVAAALP
ncbi:hypothetical protein Gorai_018261, partial [Gossypium raimondii]|nr:hypothetical protein [Gossypium raimondii]